MLTHHGKLEHGSPVTPCTREATLVHMIDNLGGTLGSFDRIEKSLADGERWSAFDRALSGSAYFAPREEARARPGRLRARSRAHAGPLWRMSTERHLAPRPFAVVAAVHSAVNVVGVAIGARSSPV